MRWKFRKLAVGLAERCVFSLAVKLLPSTALPAFRGSAFIISWGPCLRPCGSVFFSHREPSDGGEWGVADKTAAASTVRLARLPFIFRHTMPRGRSLVFR
ncbi:hypothetical protein FPV67DRAFT_1510967, partial [Lyophyllum atratum]